MKTVNIPDDLHMDVRSVIIRDRITIGKFVESAITDALRRARAKEITKVNLMRKQAAQGKEKR